MREIVINDTTIGDDHPPYVIAEVGGNHGGSVDTARKMIQMAALCGANACKLQKRDNTTLYTPSLLDAPYENENSFGKTYGEHRKALEFDANQYLSCRSVAKMAGVTLFATAFDEHSADFLMDMDVPAIKLASSSLTDEPLLRYVRSLGKPIILSTGGGTITDVDAAVDLLEGGAATYALLHCLAVYPVRNYAELNLTVIDTMRERYPDVVIGWSGHTPGISMALVAATYGASIVEMHFTLNRANKGTDNAFSLEPKGLSTLCEDLHRAYLAKGDGIKRLYESELKPLSKMRRVPTPFGMRVTGELVYAAH